MAQLYLVRHAKAGERRLWNADDIERPLSKKGWKQAELVGKRLAKHDPSVLLSSAYVRCIQTLEPLGERLDLKVEIDERLTRYKRRDYQAVCEASGEKREGAREKPDTTAVVDSPL